MMSRPVKMNQGIHNTAHGEKLTFEFQPRTHNELIEMNKWVDLPRAAKIAGVGSFL